MLFRSATSLFDETHAKRMRSLFLFGFGTYAGLVIRRLLSSEIIRPYDWFSFVITLSLGLVFAASFIKQNQKERVEWNTLFMSSLVTFHIAIGNVIYGWREWSTAGYFLLTLVFFSILNIPRNIFIYTLFFLSCTCIGIVIATQHEIPVSVLLLACALVTIFGLMSSLPKASSINQARLSEQKALTILNNMNEGIAIINELGEIKNYNQALVLLLDLKTKPKKTADLFEKWHLKTTDFSQFDINDLPGEKIFRTLTTERALLNASNSDEDQKWFRIHASLVSTKESSERLALMLVKDVTVEQEKKIVLAEQEVVLTNSAKMTALGEMAAGIAHEVNNPLAIISGAAHQLKRSVAKNEFDPSRHEQMLEKIFQPVKRITKLMNSMRSFAHEGKSDPMQRTTLEKIFEDTLIMFRDKVASSSVELKTEIEENTELDCRPWQISQVLLSLVQNSVDAMANSKVKIISIVAKSTNRYIEITISDTGAGIPIENQDRIFHPFYTTKEIGKGTGLGLSLSTNIAKSHGGTLTLLSSQPGQTIFALKFPQFSHHAEGDLL